MDEWAIVSISKRLYNNIADTRAILGGVLRSTNTIAGPPNAIPNA